MIIILNDDPVYLSWLRRHRNGFVLDTKRKATKRNTTLHRATCKEIRNAKTRRTRWTSGGRVKACSEERGELTQWAREQIGSEPKFCGVCDPVSDASPAATSAGYRRADHHLTKLESDIVSAVVESAVMHLDSDLEYRKTIGDVARYLSKTPGQISAAMLRLVSERMLEIEPGLTNGGPLPPILRVFPTASSLRTVPAFTNMNSENLQRELATLRDWEG